MSHALTETGPQLLLEAKSTATCKVVNEGPEGLRKVEASKQQLTWYPLTMDGKENIPTEVTSY